MSIRNEYNVDEFGLITDNGKFEREPIYVPHFWNAGLEGLADEDNGALQGFTLTDEDFAEFPELSKDEWEVGQTLWLHEDEFGFVTVVSDDAAKELAAVDDDEDSEPDEPDDEDYIISDARGGGYDVGHYNGSHIGEFAERDEVEQAIRDDGNAHQFFPNIWVLSDHGNFHRVTDWQW